MSVYDPGLQPERTGLAWQRTSLALGLGALVYARIAAQTVGVWAWLLGGAGILTALALGAASRRRYRYTHRSLTSGVVKLPDGVLPAALALAVATGGLIVLALTLVGPAAR
ncbi:DUF202 domain-containing protein [Tessaracoccus sp. MC1865]|uniref:DUF202 domain-containing protein n=1 Tax=unclassified Tessaracoccus TaxID=2635419 RepID=UPI0016014C63|nr:MULTISPECIES: DUF202 domain-containing protein [unclassified Tessaracoccus]MBB1482815.1 DUF202 domain-containing protein [Tessaracoccus sp. MC1865]MBB1510688.1 DUF202 domain-containing protein [Tessaracoccus sp. MC1756]QTO37743.1 DUF202 domain-containing protein [Tessaracoccus sp. MC1865]